MISIVLSALCTSFCAAETLSTLDGKNNSTGAHSAKIRYVRRIWPSLDFANDSFRFSRSTTTRPDGNWSNATMNHSPTRAWGLLDLGLPFTESTGQSIETLEIDGVVGAGVDKLNEFCKLSDDFVDYVLQPMIDQWDELSHAHNTMKAIHGPATNPVLRKTFESLSKITTKEFLNLEETRGEIAFIADKGDHPPEVIWNNHGGQQVLTELLTEEMGFPNEVPVDRIVLALSMGWGMLSSQHEVVTLLKAKLRILEALLGEQGRIQGGAFPSGWEAVQSDKSIKPVELVQVVESVTTELKQQFIDIIGKFGGPAMQSAGGRAPVGEPLDSGRFPLTQLFGWHYLAEMAERVKASKEYPDLLPSEEAEIRPRELGLAADMKKPLAGAASIDELTTLTDEVLNKRAMAAGLDQGSWETMNRDEKIAAIKAAALRAAASKVAGVPEEEHVKQLEAKPPTVKELADIMGYNEAYKSTIDLLVEANKFSRDFLKALQKVAREQELKQTPGFALEQRIGTSLDLLLAYMLKNPSPLNYILKDIKETPSTILNLLAESLLPPTSSTTLKNKAVGKLKDHIRPILLSAGAIGEYNEKAETLRVLDQLGRGGRGVGFGDEHDFMCKLEKLGVGLNYIVGDHGIVVGNQVSMEDDAHFVQGQRGQIIPSARPDEASDVIPGRVIYLESYVAKWPLKPTDSQKPKLVLRTKVQTDSKQEGWVTAIDIDSDSMSSGDTPKAFSNVVWYDSS